MAVEASSFQCSPALLRSILGTRADQIQPAYICRVGERRVERDARSMRLTDDKHIFRPTDSRRRARDRSMHLRGVYRSHHIDYDNVAYHT